MWNDPSPARASATSREGEAELQGERLKKMVITCPHCGKELEGRGNIHFEAADEEIGSSGSGSYAGGFFEMGCVGGGPDLSHRRVRSRDRGSPGSRGARLPHPHYGQVLLVRVGVAFNAPDLKERLLRASEVQVHLARRLYELEGRGPVRLPVDTRSEIETHQESRHYRYGAVLGSYLGAIAQGVAGEGAYS